MTSRWIRDLLLIPLVVGVIVAVFQFGLPLFFEKSNELSYSVDGPLRYLDDPAIGHVTVEINGVEVKNLTAYKVRLWNSGDIPLKQLPVRIAFDTNNANFEIFSVSHKTKPELEFGKVLEEKVSDTQRRFVYELLNPEDEDTLTLLANDEPPLNVYAKSENLGLRKVEARTSEQGNRWFGWLGCVSAITGALLALLFKLSVEFNFLRKK